MLDIGLGEIVVAVVAVAEIATFSLVFNHGKASHASRTARCQSFRQMVDVLKDQPQPQRVMATRWLLNEGLTLVADGQAPAG